MANTSNSYTLFVAAAVNYLKAEEATDIGNSRSNKQIVKAVRKEIESGELSIQLTDGTMLSYLSHAANQDPQSGIVSGGPRSGYWFDEPIKEDEESGDVLEVTAKGGKKRKIEERDLYPLMELWLAEKDFHSKDTSALKSGGPWGNPDILGIELVTVLGAVEINIASCEVKLSDDDWERAIFQAISHKRFANRSWFCYRVSNLEEPLPKGIEYYAERYKVGLVLIGLSDEDIISLKEGKTEPLDHIDKVVEKIPAMYDAVPLSEQKNVIERINIRLDTAFE